MISLCPTSDSTGQPRRPETTARSYLVIARGQPLRPAASLCWRATRDNLDDAVAECFELGYLTVNVRADDGREIKLEIG